MKYLAPILLISGFHSLPVYSQSSKPSPFDKLDATKIHLDALLHKPPPGVVAAALKHTRGVNTVAVSPNGGILASAGWDNKLRLWKLGDAELKVWAVLPGGPSGLAFSPDGKTLMGGAPDQSVQLWDLSGVQPKKKATLSGHSNRPFAVAISPTNKLMASGCGNPILRVWKTNDGEPETWAIIGEEDGALGVSSLSFSPEGSMLAIGHFAGVLHLWDFTPNLMWQRTIPKVNGRLTAFSPVGKQLAFTNEDSVTIWNLSDQKPKPLTVLRDGPKGLLVSPVTSLSYSSDGKLLATAWKNRKVIVWDVAAGQRRQTWTMPERINSLAFAPDSRHIALGSQDGSVAVLRMGK